MKKVLWWGRFDPDYSRNRILRQLFAGLGWSVLDFRPAVSSLGWLEAGVRSLPTPDLVWVPCFRQRDVAAAARWARSRGVPLVFDPLISAYDKQVDERGKLAAASRAASKLLQLERRQFGLAARVVADTQLHADYFSEVLGVARTRLAVVYVGAEEAQFQPSPVPPVASNEVPEVLFYGSFIPLQGPRTIIEAARLYSGPPVRWTLIGQGPLHAACVSAAQGIDRVAFESWVPYEALAARIGRAQLLLGVFGNTPKAGRVIPNKVFQSLACGRAVVTRASGAYPDTLQGTCDRGLVWVPPDDPAALAGAVEQLVSEPDELRSLGEAAAATSRQEFAAATIQAQLQGLLDGVVS